MNINTGYTFDHVEKKIIITKTFSKQAEIYKSEAYNQLSQIMKDYPSYSVVIRAIKPARNKKTYKGLTISEMNRFMKKQSEKEQQDFEEVKKIAKEKSSSYAIIKKWFLSNYKDKYNTELENINAEKENNQSSSIEEEINKPATSPIDEELENQEESKTKKKEK